ncbi:hypothetical protein [Streptomyces sp. NPDC002172]
MKASSSPVVLVVDDEPDQQLGYAVVMEERGLEVTVCQPQDVTEDHLRKSDVIAIDQVFKWQDLSHPTNLAYWPCDGLAFAGVLSRHLVRLGTTASVVLRTGAINELGGSLPLAARVPLLSSQNGVDWILEKGTTDTADNLYQLAHATAALSPFTTQEGRRDWNEGANWLQVPEESWAESALAEIQVCRPPEHVVAQYTAGSAWLRWFAHRILPYPSFLVSDLRAATLLRLTIAQFHDLVDNAQSPLGQLIRNCRYHGHLAGLAEPRWWRAGIESIVDDLLMAADQTLDVGDALAVEYSRLHESSVQTLPHEQPVVTINADYFDSGVAEFRECVRLAPDSWPVVADEPYAKQEDVDNEDWLASMVSRGDRGRLHSPEVR